MYEERPINGWIIKNLFKLDFLFNIKMGPAHSYKGYNNDEMFKFGNITLELITLRHMLC